MKMNVVFEVIDQDHYFHVDHALLDVGFVVKSIDDSVQIVEVREDGVE